MATSPLIRIPVSFRNQHTLALLDTGAAASLVSLEFFRKLHVLNFTLINKYPAVIFKTVSGKKLPVYGVYKITFILSNKCISHKFYVVSDISENCILYPFHTRP